jgi:hypothetical protein
MPTASISLVREHTEVSRPPRALWVPFDFGHPFGAPHEPEQQRRVLRELLDLFEGVNGPILRDYSGDTGAAGVTRKDTVMPWSCPIGVSEANVSEVAASEVSLEQAVEEEMRLLLPWYEHAVAERQRTTVGASNIKIDALTQFIAGFLTRPYPDNPNRALPLALVLKAAVEDLKQFYLEAASIQPGQPRPSHGQLNDWFWRETRAAELVKIVSRRAAASDDQTMEMVARHLLVPAGKT